MKEGGLQEELQEVIFQGSWQIGTKVQTRVTDLRKNHLRQPKAAVPEDRRKCM